MEKEYMDSIEKRKLAAKMNVARIAELYEEAKKLKSEIRKAEKLREENSNKVQEMLKSIEEDKLKTGEIKGLRETGKNLREELRTTNLRFNAINDELVDLILSLPNTLHPMTPPEFSQLVREVSPPPEKAPWVKPRNLFWEKIPGTSSHFPYLLFYAFIMMTFTYIA